MSLVTVSDKKNRVYQRAFDHDEAQKLRAEGWTWQALTVHFGVSEAAVRRVCDPKVRERMAANGNDWHRAHRQPCLGDCGALVWMTAPDRTGYCADCVSARRAAEAVRETELLCRKCGEWKPDAEFTDDRRRTRRRGKRTFCRACDTAARRGHRRANQDRERTVDRERKRRGKRMAKYVVMRKDEEGRWEERARTDATSRLHAIERVADDSGAWVAVTEGQLTVLEVQPAMAFKVVRPGQENGSTPEAVASA